MIANRRIALTAIDNPDAELGIVSLPVPGDNDNTIAIEGAQSQSIPVGFWPRSQHTPGGRKRSRRELVFFERNADKNPIACITPAPLESDQRGSTGWTVEAAALENVTVHKNENHWHYYKQPGEVRLRLGEKQITFSLGIRNEWGLHLWQYAGAEKLWAGPLVEAYRIGGHIYTADEAPLTMERLNELGDILMLPDNTVAASVYLLLFANGTVQITAHWINGRIYGGVGNQKGVPVVVFADADLQEGRWDGANPVVSSSGISFNFAPSAHLVSADHPGSFSISENGSIWQPFEDTRIIIRHEPADGAVKDVEVNDSAHGLVQGAARSVTWLMGTGDKTPSITRYIAPSEWYAECCEFAPFQVELKDGEFERLGRLAAEALLRNSVEGRFTSGGIYRYLDQYGLGCYELSMDANEGRSLFRRSYRDSDSRFYDLALRNSYFMADIAVDHSRDIIHYHNDAPDWRIHSLIYQRFSGIVLGYVETGDFYLLETAQAVARNYMAHHLQNWPRQGIGRDADPLNGFLMLWDYTGGEEFYQFAREFAHHVSLVIDKNGYWLSGAGVGPQMGCNAMPGSAWNGGHLLNGFTEYVMRDDNVPKEWLESAGRALTKIYEMLSKDGGYHPASSGFLGKLHWYLACRLQDPKLIEKTHELMNNILAWEKNPASGYPIFTGPSAHHMNNYVDYLTFYEATKDCLPEIMISAFYSRQTER